MIERIAQRMRHGCGPGLKFLEGLGVAGDKALGDAIGAHGAPFVMVAFEPDFEEVVKLAVFRDVARRKMAVIIKDRLFFGKLMIEPSGGSGLQEKIFVNEFHNDPLRLIIRYAEF